MLDSVKTKGRLSKTTELVKSIAPYFEDKNTKCLILTTITNSDKEQKRVKQAIEFIKRYAK